jgi:glutathione synthase/RimK-type ligase-like ATP-grasp enzyme
MSKKILIITGGPIAKLEMFKQKAQEMGMNANCASFYDLSYELVEGKPVDLRLNGKELDIDLAYIRVIGKRLEEASLFVSYAKSKGIRLVDKIYSEAEMMPSTILKTLEMKKLFEAGLPIPKTYHASLSEIFKNSETILGFPFVIKSAIGQKARGVWSPKTRDEMPHLYKNLRLLEMNEGSTFFAQEMIRSVKRVRVLVVGEKVLGAIVRGTKFRKRFLDAVDGEYPEAIKETIKEVPKGMVDLSVSAAKACGLEIAGIDILIEEGSEKMYVIEANAAPSWNLISKYCDTDVEYEILNYLRSL